MKALCDELHELVEQNVGLAWAVVNRWRRSGLDVDDLAQAGMIGLCKAARTFDPERGAFSTYATHWIKAEIRRAAEKLLKHQGIASLLDEPPSGRPGVDDEIADHDAMDRVWREVDRLPEKDRQVIRGRFWEGLSQSQISERMGTTRTRVYQREHRGLGRLREALVR
jgi:RNA polymerase sigma factor (sigma-70 family)